MRIAALLVALFAIVVGVVGIFTPDSLVTIGWYVVTPVGLAAIAALRVAIGLVLMLVAPISRVPRTLRVVGAVVLVAGRAGRPRTDPRSYASWPAWCWPSAASSRLRLQPAAVLRAEQGSPLSLARVHQTLRVTPAMEAGIADHVWLIEEIVGLLR